jgi:hypothetical protein
MKSTIVWDVTPCSPLKANRRFGGTYSLHLQGRRINRARNQRESMWQAELCWQLTTLLFYISRSSWMNWIKAVSIWNFFSYLRALWSCMRTRRRCCRNWGSVYFVEEHRREKLTSVRCSRIWRGSPVWQSKPFRFYTTIYGSIYSFLLKDDLIY